MAINMTDDYLFVIDTDEVRWRKVRFYREIPYGLIGGGYNQWQEFYAKRWDEYEHQIRGSDHYWCRCTSCKGLLDKYLYGKDGFRKRR